MEEQLNLMREADMAREAAAEAERKAEEEAKRAEREAEAQRREKEAKAKRLQDKQSHQQTAEHNAAFHDKEGSPWTAENAATVPNGVYIDSNDIEANIRTLQHELSLHYGYPVSLSIGYKGSEYVLCWDARNGQKELPSADLLQFFGCEHISECLSRANQSLDTLREQARAAAEQAKKKSEMEEKLKQLLAEADTLRATIASM